MVNWNCEVKFPSSGEKPMDIFEKGVEVNVDAKNEKEASEKALNEALKRDQVQKMLLATGHAEVDCI